MTTIDTEKIESQVYVPGTLMATIKNGRIVNFTFMPAAADAGYFGDHIMVYDGDDISSEKFFDLVSYTLTFDSREQSAHFTCEWQS